MSLLDKGTISLPSDQNSADRAKVAQLNDKRNEILSHFLTQSAKERLQRVMIVNAEKGSKVEAIILSQAQTGQLAPQSVDENKIKELLEIVSSGDKKGTSGIVFAGSSAEATGEGHIIINRTGSAIADILDERSHHESDDELSF